MKNKRIIVVVGPTASGKSALAVRLARRIGGEIISADSRQVYKGLDIGTGKITKREMRGIPHHLLDVASPKRVFTAHEYVALGRRALEDILARGKTPIVCGGSGFYIDALLGRIHLPDVPADTKLRAQLSKKTPSQLFALLKKLDPKRAKAIDRQNPVRLIRAIEIAKRLGKVPAVKPQPLPYDIEWIGITMDDATLKKRIHKRLIERMDAGMVREAQRLHTSGLSYARMQELGLEYRYLAALLKKKITPAEMREMLERDIWKYAKRQKTYWRRNKEIRWGPPTS